MLIFNMYDGAFGPAQDKPVDYITVPLFLILGALGLYCYFKNSSKGGRDYD
jgi:hypothetical protein